jgi:hypothetical protein
LNDHAAQCEQVNDLNAAAASDAASAADAASDAADAAIARAAFAAAAYGGARKEIFQIAVAILDEAIRLGNQADSIETSLVVGRMEAMKRRALCALTT